MIGLITLTAPDGSHVYVNPNSISFLAPNTPQFCRMAGVDPKVSNGKGSCLMVAGLPFQVQDNPNQIINALTRLRIKNEKNQLKLRDSATREPWQDGEDEDDN